MIDNIPYRHIIGNLHYFYDNENGLLLQNLTYDNEFFIITQPSSRLSDPDEQLNGAYVTTVYCYNNIYDCVENCLELVFASTIQEAEITHGITLAKWNTLELQ